MNELQTIDESKLVIRELPNLQVTNQISYERVIEFRNLAVEKKKLIEETFNPIVQKAHESHKQATSTRARFLDPIILLINTIDSNVKSFKREQERIAFEQQEKLRREAEEKARKEKEALEKRAEKWEEKGNADKAEELREKAQEVEPLVATVAPTYSKMKGDTTRKTWRAEIVDVNIIPREYMIPDIQTLNALARTKKGTIKIAGVKFYEE